jgi:hypothetical protein
MQAKSLRHNGLNRLSFEKLNDRAQIPLLNQDQGGRLPRKLRTEWLRCSSRSLAHLEVQPVPISDVYDRSAGTSRLCPKTRWAITGRGGQWATGGFSLSNRPIAVGQSMACAHLIDSASRSFSPGTLVSSEDCADEGTVGGNRWRIACETESSDRIDRKCHRTASSANSFINRVMCRGAPDDVKKGGKVAARQDQSIENTK